MAFGKSLWKKFYKPVKAATNEIYLADEQEKLRQCARLASFIHGAVPQVFFGATLRNCRLKACRPVHRLGSTSTSFIGLRASYLEKKDDAHGKRNTG
jgi:hypothetical protein